MNCRTHSKHMVISTMFHHPYLSSFSGMQIDRILTSKFYVSDSTSSLEVLLFSRLSQSSDNLARNWLSSFTKTSLLRECTRQWTYYYLFCYLELFLQNAPQVLNIGGDIAHDAVDIGNVCGIDVFISGAETNPNVPCYIDITSGTKGQQTDERAQFRHSECTITNSSFNLQFNTIP